MAKEGNFFSKIVDKITIELIIGLVWLYNAHITGDKFLMLAGIMWVAVWRIILEIRKGRG